MRNVKLAYGGYKKKSAYRYLKRIMPFDRCILTLVHVAVMIFGRCHVHANYPGVVTQNKTFDEINACHIWTGFVTQIHRRRSHWGKNHVITGQIKVSSEGRRGTCGCGCARCRRCKRYRRCGHIRRSRRRRRCRRYRCCRTCAKK
ncbi:b119 [miniopterid betaherpesvirus 1]|uniref:B119 n=1 Tax=miniopterid betaherpesvirus 1 TaxID=3070189 RepID=I3VQA9_9BETA|nr:b119 [miniopterid betaherpesvirus 1]AFK83953.1 b119 [miniopterid betaherpesvirus 1]